MQAKAVLREDLNELGLLEAFQKGREQLNKAIGRFMKALEDKLKEPKGLAAPVYEKLKTVIPITGKVWKSSDHAALVKEMEKDENVVQSLRNCCFDPITENLICGKLFRSGSQYFILIMQPCGISVFAVFMFNLYFSI